RCSPTSPWPTRSRSPPSPSAPRPSCSVIEQIDALLAQARKELEGAAGEQQLEAARVKYLGKHGSLSGLRKSLGQVPAADRPRVGKLVTDAIAQFEALLEQAKKSIADRSLRAALEREPL